MDLAGQLDAAAERAPDRIFLIDATGTGPPCRYTLGDVASLASTLRAQLAGEVAAGEPIALGIARPGDYAAVYVALLAAGQTIVPVAPTAPERELERIMTAAGARLLIDDLPVNRPDAVRLRHRAASDQRRGMAPGVVMFTSGTTAAPKGVSLDVDQLWHNAGAVVAAHEFGPDDVGLCPLPLWHINAQVIGVLAALRAGAALVLDQGFHRSTFWRLAHEHQVTWANAAPAVVHLLGTDDDVTHVAPASMRFVRSASAPLPIVARERFERRFGVPVIESYGMTEAAGMITVNSLDRPRKPGSAGRPAGVDVRVVGADAMPAPPGQAGSVQIKGASVITAYLADVDADRLDDGWLVTGDLGYFDHDGDLFLLGRADDVINRGGEMVHPREVEEVLLTHPQVSAAAVVGVPDEKLGERVVALVIANGDASDATLTPSTQALKADLDAACRRELSAYKCPSEFRLVEELPIGATGKIRHRQARLLAGVPS